jgi:hypothetical protein
MPLTSGVSHDQELHDRMVEGVRAAAVALAIRELAAGYVALYALVHVSDINDGCCHDFASDLQLIFPRVQVKWIRDIDPDLYFVGHAVAILDECYYDAETPEGVAQLAEIPLVKRLIAQRSKSAG